MTYIDDSTLESRQRRRVIQSSAGAFAISAFAPIANVWTAASPHAVVNTRTGKIAGMRESGIYSFKGIRYGADTRKHRFRVAVPPEAWRRVRDALEYGPSCPQRNAREPTSEDCLYLNVWTPGLRDEGKRPVLVYFHGGEFSSGSGSSPLYDGTNLCERGDVVVVTVNHRLNIFGHLYL